MKAAYKLLVLVIATLATDARQSWAEAPAPALEEVLVSARKRAESLQEVPVSVSAVTAGQMATAGIRDVADLTTLVPALVVTTNSNPFNTSYRIRRIGNEGNIPDFEPDTGLFIDGAYRSRSGLGLGDLADVEQIEVLRGPQSTLYGKNVTAGVISVRTSAPSQTFGAMGELTLGEDALQGFRGTVNGGLTDRVSGRFSMTGTQRDTIQENVVGPDADDLNQYALRGQLLIEPMDALSIRLIGAHSYRNMKPQLAEMHYGPAVTALVNATATMPALLGAADGPGLADGAINAGARPILDNDPKNNKVQHGQSLTFFQDADDFIAAVEYRADTYTLTSVSSYDSYEVVQNWNDAGQTGLDLVSYRDRQTGDTFSQEFRVDSTFGADILWQAGVFYYDNQFRRGDRGRDEFVLGDAIDELGVAAGLASPTLPNVPVFGLPGDTGNFYEKSDSESLGIFAQTTWNATDALALTLGLRYTREEKDVSLVNTPLTTAPGPLAALSLPVRTLTPAATSFAMDDSWDAVTGTFNTQYTVSPGTMVYGTVATGFKGGGFNAGFGNTPLSRRPFDEEHVTNFEVGAKTEIGGRVRLNAAAFWTEYEDFQSASYIGLQFLVNNAETVIVKGFEADMTAQLTDEITTDVSVTYAKAEYDEYTQGSCYTGRTPTDAATGACDLSGETLPFAPKLTATAGIQWEHPIGPGSVYSRLDANYVDEQNVTSELDPNHGKQDAYTLMNFRLGWKQGMWDASAWVRNLNDETYVAQTLQSNLFSSVGDGTYQSYLGAARSVGVTIRATY